MFPSLPLSTIHEYHNGEHTLAGLVPGIGFVGEGVYLIL